MSARATPQDVTVLSVASISLLGITTQGTLTVNGATSEGRSISRFYGNAQPTKNSWTYTGSNVNTKSGATRVTNLDLTGVSILGTAFESEAESLSLNASFTHVPGDACEDPWAYPVVVDGTISGSVALKVPTSAVPLMASLDGPTDMDGTFTFVLNGITFTVPVVITSAAHTFGVGAVQMVNVDFTSQDPLTGDHPAAPTGTTTLLEKIFNTPKTAQAFAFTSKGVGGLAYTGNAVIQSYALRVANGQVVTEDMTWAGVGALAQSVTS